MESNLSSLQQRLEETLNLNNKLNHGLKKQEEKFKDLEKLLQSEEDRNEEKSDQLLGKERFITRQKTKTEELEAAIMERERDLSELEVRISHLTINDDNKSKAAEIMKEKDVVIGNLKSRITSLESSASKQETVVLKSSKEKEDQVENLQKKINEISAEKHKMRLTIQEKEGNISDVQGRIEELQLKKTDSDKMNHILNEKNSQIHYLRDNVEGYEKEVTQMETRFESLSSDLNRAKGSIKQKTGRLTTLKSHLEEAVSKNHNLANELGLKKEKITLLEKSLDESQKKEQQLKEELHNLESQIDELQQRLGSTSAAVAEKITEKVQLTKRASESPVGKQVQPMTSDGHLRMLEDQIELLKKEKSRVIEHSEAVSGKNASLQTENESLRSDLDLLRSDYEIMQEDMNEAKEHYRDLDISATKIAHRCEVLVQLNSTLEEENRTLLDQVNKLLSQNHLLLVQTLQSRDTFLEDERAFSDRLYMLERDKEKLTTLVDSANKALLDHANTGPKKKNMFLRGAHKVLKKAGIRKLKKEEGKNATRSPESGDIFSDTSDSSFSPSHDRSGHDDTSLHSSMHSSLTFSPSFGPIRSALSRSKQNIYNVNDVSSPQDNVVMRRPKSCAVAVDSMSSGSENGDRKIRPRSEFIAPTVTYRVPVRKNLHRPRSMELLANTRSDDETRKISVVDEDDSQSLPNMRKTSFASTKSTVSNPSSIGGHNEVVFSVTGYRGEAENSPVQRVRVTKRLIAGTAHVRDGSNISHESEDTDIVVYSDARPIEPRKVSFQSEIVRNLTLNSGRKESVGSQETPRSIASDSRSEHTESPLPARSSIFYQPTDKDGPDDLPEADQRTPRKESTVFNNQEEAANSTPTEQARSVRETSNDTPQQSVATQEVVITSTTHTPDRPSEELNSKQDKTTNQEQSAEKKKSAVWYDYGRV